MINLEKQYVRRVETLENYGHDQAVLLTKESGLYFSLNEAGALLWQALKDPRSLRELAEILTAEFEISLETATQDATSFLEMCVETALVASADGLAP